MHPVTRKREREEFETVDLSKVPRVVPNDPCCNHLWITTNEAGDVDLLNRMRKISIVGDTIIGVSGFYTLDLAVQRGDSLRGQDKKIEQIIIIDNGLAISHFWNGVAKIVRRCTKRESAISKIKAFLLESDSFFYHCKKRQHNYTIKCGVEKLQDCIENGISWLSNDAWYKKGKALFDQKRIHHIISDLCDPKTMGGVVNALELAGHTVDTVYFSNVFTFPYEPYNKDPEAAEKVRLKVPGNANRIEALPCKCREGCSSFWQTLVRSSDAK